MLAEKSKGKSSFLWSIGIKFIVVILPVITFLSICYLDENTMNRLKKLRLRFAFDESIDRDSRNAFTAQLAGVNHFRIINVRFFDTIDEMKSTVLREDKQTLGIVLSKDNSGDYSIKLLHNNVEFSKPFLFPYNTDNQVKNTGQRSLFFPWTSVGLGESFYVTQEYIEVIRLYVARGISAIEKKENTGDESFSVEYDYNDSFDLLCICIASYSFRCFLIVFYFFHTLTSLTNRNVFSTQTLNFLILNGLEKGNLYAGLLLGSLRLNIWRNINSFIVFVFMVSFYEKVEFNVFRGMFFVILGIFQMHIAMIMTQALILHLKKYQKKMFMISMTMLFLAYVYVKVFFVKYLVRYLWFLFPVNTILMFEINGVLLLKTLKWNNIVLTNCFLVGNVNFVMFVSAFLLNAIGVTAVSYMVFKKKYFDRKMMVNSKNTNTVAALKNVTVNYGNYAAVKDVSVDFNVGKVYCLLGLNGAGKTTVLKTLFGMLKPTSGEIVLSTTNVGYSPQEMILFEEITVREMIMYFSEMKDINPATLRSLIQYMIKEMDMGEYIDTKISTLSMGRKRKTQIALSLVGKPSLVVLDEPTSGLDPESRMEIWKTIDIIKKSRTVIICTHQMDEAKILGDEKLFMKDGSLIFKGNTEELEKKFGFKKEMHVVLKEDQRNKKDDVADRIVEIAKQNQVTVEDYSSESRIVFMVREYETENEFIKFMEEVEKIESIDSYFIENPNIGRVFSRINDVELVPFKSLPQREKKRPLLKDILMLFAYNKLFYGFDIGCVLFLVFVCISRRYSCREEPSFMKNVDRIVPDDSISFVNHDPYEYMTQNNIEEEELNPAAKEAFAKAKNVGLYVKDRIEYRMEAKSTSREDRGTTLFCEIHIRRQNDIRPKYKIGLSSTSNLHTSFDEIYMNSVLADYYLQDKKISLKTESITENSRSDDIHLYVFFILSLIIFLYMTASTTTEQILGILSKRLVYFKLYGMNPIAIEIYTVAITVIKVLEAFFLPLLVFTIVENKSLSGLGFVFRAEMLLALISFMTYIYSRIKVFNSTLSGGHVVGMLIYSILVKVVSNNPEIQAYIINLEDGSISAIAIDYAFAITKLLLLLSPFSYVGVTGYISKGTLTPRGSNTQIDVRSINGSFSIMMQALFKPFDSIFRMIIETENMPFWSAVMWIFFSMLTVFLDVSSVYFSNKSVMNVKNTGETEETLNERKRVYANYKDNECVNLSNVSLTKRYGTTYSGVLALHNVTIDFPQNSITAILGETGSGKTTMIEQMCGTSTPTKGYVFINKKNVHQDLAPGVIKYCPQFDNLVREECTMRYHLELIGELAGYTNEEIDAYIKSIANVLMFEKHLDKNVSDLSGGTKRKLSLVLALMGRSSAAILDEPTTGLDPLARKNAWDVLRTVKKEQSVVITTHEVEDAVDAEKVVIMSSGEVKSVGTIDVLKKIYTNGYRMVIMPRKDVNIHSEVLREVFKDDVNPLYEVYEATAYRRVVEVRRTAFTYNELYKRLVRVKELELVNEFDLTSYGLEDVYKKITIVKKYDI